MSRTIQVANPGERCWTSGSYLFWFGAYGTTRVLAYGNHLEEALEAAVDWIVDNEPGHLMDEQVEEAFREARGRGLSEEEAREEAEADMTCFGHSGLHYLASWEWGIIAERPSKEQLISLHKGWAS